MAKPLSPLQNLHVKLLKPSVRRFDTVVNDPDSLTRYSLQKGLGFTGRLYIARPSQSPPRWLQFVQTGVPDQLRELTNRTNAAVLLIRHANRFFAFTFGHGRHLLRDELTVSDFGLKTSLNALKHDSLRSLDTFTIEDQTVHTRAQASRASGVEVFGLDIGRDILRAVTGNPRAEIPFGSVSGAEDTIAITTHTDFPGLTDVCQRLLSLYRKRTYRANFSWVDNVARVNDPSLVDELDQSLLGTLVSPAEPRPYMAPPEPIDWQTTGWFGYTRQPNLRDADLSLEQYMRRPPRNPRSIQRLKRDRVLAFNAADASVPSQQWPVYKCLVYEVTRGKSRFVLVNGTWFEVNRDFATSIRTALASMPVSDLPLDQVHILAGGRFEPEGDYNARLANKDSSFALLDKKTAKCRTASTPIEFCDLLTTSRHLIHVKHRKGGSSSLSHLFAQARVSSEAFLADEGFRQGIRDHLASMTPSFLPLVPEERPSAGQYTVVFAILGTQARHPGDDLPFFSQLNLVRTQEALLSMGFAVDVLGVPAAKPARNVAG